MNKLISFDIEIASTIPEGVDDWSTLHPLGISCAATWASDEDKPRVWCGRYFFGDIARQMSIDEVCAMIAHLSNMQDEGYRIVTFNGAGFDFRELAASLPLDWGRKCQELAWNHCDIFFQVFCQLGYSPGLAAIAEGMGVGSKTKDVDGALAPELWQAGQYGKVLDYVANDALLTLQTAQAIEAAGEVRWTSRSGRPQVEPIDRQLSVAEASELPVPDTSWMDDAWSRSKFVGWLQ